MDDVIDKIIETMNKIKKEEKKNIFQDRLNNILSDSNQILDLIEAIKSNNQEIILNYLEEKENTKRIMKNLLPFYLLISNSIAE